MAKIKTQNIVVSKSKAGQRIDNFLINLLKGVPRSRVYRIIRRGEVRVNKKRIKPFYRLCSGDFIRIPPIRLSEKTEKTSPSGQLITKLKQSVLFENNDLLIINKLAGLAVHGGSGVKVALIETLRYIYPNISLELAHRLDKETSGCLIIAKNRETLLSLHQLLKQGKLTKTYLALTKGHWDQQQQIIELPLKKSCLLSGERMTKISTTGKMAKTEIFVKKRFQLAELTKIKIYTGRTHQIRVHTSHLKHPIAGDTKYGDYAFNRQMKSLGLKRLFLHASEIKFKLNNKTVSVTAPLDNDLLQILRNLEGA